MITDRQRDDRRKGLGASDVPALFGCDPFKTAYDVWAIKTGRLDSTAAGQAAHVGNMIERGILDLAAHELGRKVCAPKGTIVRGCLRVNVDGFLDRAAKGSTIVEAKLTSIAEGWGKPGSDEVPERVRLQVTAQMHAAESPRAYVARLLCARGAQFDLFLVSMDPDLAYEIEHRCSEFWEKHVEADTPPPNTGPSADVAARLARIAGKRVALPPDLIARERELKERLKAAESEYDDAKGQLLAALGDADGGDAPGWSVSYRQCSTERIDAEKLRGVFPDVAAQCTATSTYRRLDVRRLKGGAS